MQLYPRTIIALLLSPFLLAIPVFAANDYVSKVRCLFTDCRQTESINDDSNKDLKTVLPNPLGETSPKVILATTTSSNLPKQTLPETKEVSKEENKNQSKKKHQHLHKPHNHHNLRFSNLET